MKKNADGIKRIYENIRQKNDPQTNAVKDALRPNPAHVRTVGDRDWTWIAALLVSWDKHQNFPREPRKKNGKFSRKISGKPGNISRKKLQEGQRL
jgi:hypothetical protein